MHLLVLFALVFPGTGTLGTPLAGDNPILVNDLLVLRGSEQGQSEDWNGDGDQDDVVLVVRDLELGTDTILPIALASEVPRLVGDRVFFVVKESGGQDWNGDGDDGDEVLYSLDTETRAVQNHALAVSELHYGTNVLAVEVDEGHQGLRDLNGDGDLLDDVLFVWKMGSSDLSSAGLALQRPGVNLLELPPQVGERLVSATVYEQSQGADLNADGDIEDMVVMLIDPATGSPALLDIPTPQTYALDEPLLWFDVSEADMGMDLTGDGDQLDLVLHVASVQSGAVINSGSAGTLGSQTVRRSGPYVTLVQNESFGPGDLNGDGDLGDNVLQVMTLGEGPPSNVGLSIWAITEVHGPRALVQVPETGQSQDLDGNGITTGITLGLYDFRTGTTDVLGGLGGGAVGSNFGLSSRFLPDGTVLFLYRESSAQQDLNGDGDQLDGVLHWVDRTGELHNLGVATNDLAFKAAVLADGVLVVAVQELPEGVDLNGNGLLTDFVLHAIELSSGVAVNTGLNVGQGAEVAVLGGVISGTTEEAKLNADLNGDGDMDDFAVFAIPSPF